jgi:hypothetical protein
MKAGYSAQVGASVALVAATAKTVLSVIAPAQFGVDLRQIHIGFDGAVSTATPVLVELVTFTTDGKSYPPAYGRTDKAGHYQVLFSYDTQGAIVGKNRVQIRPNLNDNGAPVVKEFCRAQVSAPSESGLPSAV